MVESFLEEETDSSLCILITTGNIESNLLPVYFLNRRGIQLLARNQPHYCHMGNADNYLHNKSGHFFSFHFQQYTTYLVRRNVCSRFIIK